MRAKTQAATSAERDADDEAEAELLHDEQQQVVEPVVVRLLDPRDQAERERDRHRVVAARLGLERAREPAADVREAERREDRGGVGRGDDGAEQDRLEPGEVEEHVRGDARQDRADDDADRAQQRGRHRDLAQPAPRGLEAALVEDQREPDDADLARELGVVELDPARPVRAEQHPEREERRQHRQPGPGGAERDDDAAGEDRADQQEHQALRPRSYLSRWESAPPRGTLPAWRRVPARARSAGSRRSRRSRSGTGSATSSSGTS